MRPTVAEERAHAMVEQLDDWELTAEERRWLERLRGPAVRRKTWWQRVSRRG